MTTRQVDAIPAPPSLALGVLYPAIDRSIWPIWRA